MLRLVEPLYLVVLERSVVVSLAATLLAHAGCLSDGGGDRPRGWQTLLLFLVVLPFWTSFLVRTYAWIFLLRDTGLINPLQALVGIVQHPLRMLYNAGAVLFGLVSGYIPFMVLPIYASLETLDPALVEAADALGAPAWPPSCG